MLKARLTAKKELNRAAGNIDWALHHLQAVLKLGYENREEYKNIIDNIAMTLVLAQESIRKFEESI